MVTGIFTIIGVALGFYLAKYQSINKKAMEVIKTHQKNKKPGYAEKMVVSTDEAALEQAQIAQAEADQEEKIDIKDILKTRAEAEK